MDMWKYLISKILPILDGWLMPMKNFAIENITGIDEEFW